MREEAPTRKRGRREGTPKQLEHAFPRGLGRACGAVSQVGPRRVAPLPWPTFSFLRPILSCLPQRFSVEFVHRVRFTRDLLSSANQCLGEALACPDEGGQRRAIVFIDSGVAASWPDTAARLTAALARPGMPSLAHVGVIPGGERCKTDLTAYDTVMAAINEHHIDRRSWVIGIGGGAVLDVVGFAAATGHRGVRHVRIPTTVLAQDDAAMGVKSGLNRFGKKNFVGSFAPPWAVLCDFDFLRTLAPRDWRAGFSEAVKIALLRDRALLEQLEAEATAIAAGVGTAGLGIIERSAMLHLRHITEGGDPFELQQARPLDFGHWAAHRLERMSDWTVSHGEAVAIGLALDCTISHLLGWLSEAELARIIRLLEALGLPTAHPLLERVDELITGLEEFREHLGGQLMVTMLRGITQPVDVHSIDPGLLRRAIAQRLAAARTTSQQ